LSQQISVEARDVNDVRRMIRGQSRCTKVIGTSEASKVLHRSCVGCIALGVRRFCRDPLLEQETRHSAPAEVHREREPDGPSSGDDYWNVSHDMRPATLVSKRPNLVRTS